MNQTDVVTRTFPKPIKEMTDSLEGMTEVMTYTLADAILDGSNFTKQACGTWGGGERACALSSAAIAAKAHGFID